MRGKLLLVFMLMGGLVFGCTSPTDMESVYTLNGKQIAMKGAQTLFTPKGIEVEVTADHLSVLMNGEEEIDINGKKFRAYGEKIEVDGRAFPVASGETLVITPEGIMVRASGVGATGGSE